MELSSVEHITKSPLPWRLTPIIPLGDIQLQPNRDVVDWKRLLRLIEWGAENDAYYLGMGDYYDLESPSNRERLHGAGYYDSVMDALDAQAEELQEEMEAALLPTKGRWLGLLEGHHFHQFQDGTTSDTRLAQYLGAPFLGTCAYVRLTFAPPDNADKWKIGPPGITIWAHHGRGGGKLSSAPLNSLEHMIKGFDADIYAVGHHHKANAARLSRIYPTFGPKRGWLDHRDLYLITTGSFLKGYLEGHKRGGRAQGLYPERGMMTPVSLGHVVIWVKPGFRNLTPERKGSSNGIPTVTVTVEV